MLESSIPFILATGFLAAVVGTVAGLGHYAFRPRLGPVRKLRYSDSRGRPWTETAPFEERNARGYLGKAIHDRAFGGVTVTVTDRHLVIRANHPAHWLFGGLDRTIPVEQIVSLKVEADLVKVRSKAQQLEDEEFTLKLKWSSRFVSALESSSATSVSRESAP